MAIIFRFRLHVGLVYAMGLISTRYCRHKSLSNYNVFQPSSEFYFGGPRVHFVLGMFDLLDIKDNLGVIRCPILRDCVPSLEQNVHTF